MARADNSHNPAPRKDVQAVFDAMYAESDTLEDPSKRLRHIGYQRVALLYIVYALGALHSLELPAGDPSAEEYLVLAQQCLVKGDFLRDGTLPGVQALNLMGHFYLETEKGRDGEMAWPIWGLVMRIIQAVSGWPSAQIDDRWVYIATGSGGDYRMRSLRSVGMYSGNVTPSRFSK